MRFRAIPGLAAAFFLGTVAHAAAQTVLPALPSRAIQLPPMQFAADTPQQRLADLARWTHDYESWKAWSDQWRNRTEPGWLSAKKRREPPVPPDWLPAACAGLPEVAGPLGAGCRDWRDWNRDLAADLMAQRATQARKVHEALEKTIWWERVHLDAFWPMTRSGTSAFGVAGVHTTLQVTKRLQVFMTPGAIVMRLPGLDGRQTWSPATDWGFSVSLFDFRMPGIGRPSTMHLNMARVWLLGAEQINAPGDLYLAGFSVTFKRR